MSATYSVIVCDASGNPLDAVTDFTRLSYSRVDREVTPLTLRLPYKPSQSLFRTDNRIEVYRSVDGRPAVLDTETIWFVKGYKQTTDENGIDGYEVTAYSANELLQRRIVAFAAGTAQAQKYDYADDMMREIVVENFLTAAYTNDPRLVSSAFFSVIGEQSAAPKLNKAFSWRPVGDVLKEIAEAATLLGTYTTFDVVAINSTELQFRTYIGQRGTDRRFPGGIQPFLFGVDYGNLATVTLTADATNERTAVYAGGGGQESSRLIVTASDDLRSAVSPFGRRESFIDARTYDTTAGLTAEAYAELQNRIPRQVIEAQIKNAGTTQYGVNWSFGDYVSVTFNDVIFDARVVSVEVSESGGQESVTVWLKGEMLNV